MANTRTVIVESIPALAEYALASTKQPPAHFSRRIAVFCLHCLHPSARGSHRQLHMKEASLAGRAGRLVQVLQFGNVADAEARQSTRLPLVHPTVGN